MGNRHRDEPVSDEEVFLTGTRWVEASLMEAQRFEDVVREWDSAMLDAAIRRQIEQGAEEQWRGHAAEKVPSLALNWQMQSELDLLVVSLRNVMRATQRLDMENAGMTGQKIIAALRNAQEHFDSKGWAARKLEAERPDHPTDLVVKMGGEFYIAGIPLSRIRAWLARVDSLLRTKLSGLGHNLPDDHASLVEGDDDLPGERLRYTYWQVPRVDDADWPRKEAPPEALELARAMFQRLRRRDDAD